MCKFSRGEIRKNNEITYNYFSKIGYKNPPINLWKLDINKKLNNRVSTDFSRSIL